jgi:hypothetical protein
MLLVVTHESFLQKRFCLCQKVLSFLVQVGLATVERFGHTQKHWPSAFLELEVVCSCVKKRICFGEDRFWLESNYSSRDWSENESVSSIGLPRRNERDLINSGKCMIVWKSMDMARSKDKRFFLREFDPKKSNGDLRNEDSLHVWW